MLSWMTTQRDSGTGGPTDAPERAMGTESSQPVTPPRAPGKAEEGATARDVLYVHSRTERESYRVLRSRDNRIEVGELQNLREGQPIHGEVVRLQPIEGRENVFDVEVLLDAPASRASGGPVQVATAAYRRNWDAIFGKADVDPSAPN